MARASALAASSLTHSQRVRGQCQAPPNLHGNTTQKRAAVASLFGHGIFGREDGDGVSIRNVIMLREPSSTCLSKFGVSNLESPDSQNKPTASSFVFIAISVSMLSCKPKLTSTDHRFPPEKKPNLFSLQVRNGFFEERPITVQLPSRRFQSFDLTLRARNVGVHLALQFGRYLRDELLPLVHLCVGGRMRCAAGTDVWLRCGCRGGNGVGRNRCCGRVWTHRCCTNVASTVRGDASWIWRGIGWSRGLLVWCRLCGWSSPSCWWWRRVARVSWPSRLLLSRSCGIACAIPSRVCRWSWSRTRSWSWWCGNCHSCEHGRIVPKN